MINQFKKYTDSYLNKVNGDSKQKIILKIDHSLAVKKIAEQIAENEFDSIEDKKLAKYCGLYHDIGRFEQLYKYNTYWDKLSIDHGLLGSQIIDEFNFNISDEDFIILKNSILYHNKYIKPDNFDERTTKFINLTRDVDKIDIYRVVLKYHKQDLLDVDDDISDKVYNTFLNQQPINYDDIQTKMDLYILQLSWIYDLNFNETINIIKKQKYYNQIYSLLPITKRLEIIKKQINIII